MPEVIFFTLGEGKFSGVLLLQRASGARVLGYGI